MQKPGQAGAGRPSSNTTCAIYENWRRAEGRSMADHDCKTCRARQATRTVRCLCQGSLQEPQGNSIFIWMPQGPPIFVDSLVELSVNILSTQPAAPLGAAQAPLHLLMAATISANSGLSDAPPTKKPSMSGIAESSGAFLALAEPPYWMRIASATSEEAFSEISLRMPACVACASSGVAVRPVPMAH